MIRKDNIDVKKLITRIEEENRLLTHASAVQYAEKLIAECPSEMLANVQEYMEKRPFSDVYIGNLSVNKLMKIWNNSCTFPVAVTAMYLYKMTGCQFEEDAIRYGAPWYDSSREA